MRDLRSLSTYLHLPEKCNKLCLVCRLNLLNFSSLDKLVSKRECKQKNEMLHFSSNLFISLTYILASGSTKVNPEKERGSAGKKRELYSGVSRIRFKGKDKRNLHFKLINYPMARYFKD